MELEGQTKTSVKTKFTWNISNFPQLKVKKLYSDTFIAGGCKWCLLLFPKGNEVDDLSIYLDVADSTKLPYGWKRDAEFSVSVIAQSSNNATVKKEFKHVFSARESDWGFKSFMPLREIKNPAERYLVEDTLTVECEVLVLFAAHYSKVESEKEVIRLNPEAPELVVDIDEKGPVASEPVKTSADVQTVCKGLITELSSMTLQSVSNKEISVPSEASSSPVIQQQQKEALQGFFNMSLEALQQANCFVNIEGILHTLVQHTDNLQEKTILEDIMSRLAEFKESIPLAKAVVDTAQARRASLVEKTAELDSKLKERKKELSTLESEFSTLSEGEAKLEVEIQRLMSQKEEFVTQKKSVSLKLERANEDTCKDIDEWRNLEGEIKKANAEWLGGKEKLASANVRWKLFREDLGFGKLNIS